LQLLAQGPHRRRISEPPLQPDPQPQGLGRGELTAKVHPADIEARSLELAGARTAELVTIYRGADVSDSDASRFSDAVQTRFPNLSVESMTGGQPHYDFIISVE
jgi:hypothetical protein